MAIRRVSDCLVRPARDGTRYWRVISGSPETFAAIKSYKPTSAPDRTAWVRGLFDSEGTAYFQVNKRYPNCYHRRVSMASSNHKTLRTAKAHLKRLGIGSSILSTKLTAGHYGTKPMYELRLSHSLENYSAFAWEVGSSIARKMDKLRKISLSYSIDLKESMRSAQRIGAANRRASALGIILPRVLSVIKSRMDSGKPVRTKDCLNIPGYASMLNYFRPLELQGMAKSGKLISPTRRRG